jgi:hypothetical protein
MSLFSPILLSKAETCKCTNKEIHFYSMTFLLSCKELICFTFTSHLYQPQYPSPAVVIPKRQTKYLTKSFSLCIMNGNVHK